MVQRFVSCLMEVAPFGISGSSVSGLGLVLGACPEPQTETKGTCWVQLVISTSSETVLGASKMYDPAFSLLLCEVTWLWPHKHVQAVAPYDFPVRALSIPNMRL